MIEPKVILVGFSDCRERAWKNSRPTFDSEDMKMQSALGMDMSFNSLCMLTFEVTSSVLFRDFLFAIRPIYAWAMSTRDVEFTEETLQLSAECGWGAHALDGILERTREGVDQNILRMDLPLTLSTTYTIAMDFRTVCGLIKTMRKIDTHLYCVYGEMFQREICHIEGYKDNKIKEFSKSYLLTEEELEPSPLRRYGDMFYGSRRMNSALAAQFLRQSQSKVKIDIWNEIREVGYEEACEMRQCDDVRVAYYIPANIYIALMVNRSHWFADWRNGMWGEIIGEYVEEMTIQEFWEFIPSGNGKPDPYHYHTLKRVNGDDLNSPCPIALEMPSLLYDRLDSQGPNPVIKRYINLYEQGYIKYNPDNKMQIAYKEMLDAKGSK